MDTRMIDAQGAAGVLQIGAPTPRLPAKSPSTLPFLGNGTLPSLPSRARLAVEMGIWDGGQANPPLKMPKIPPSPLLKVFSNGAPSQPALAEPVFSGGGGGGSRIQLKRGARDFGLH